MTKIPKQCKYCKNYNQWVERVFKFFWKKKGNPFCAMAQKFQFPCNDFMENDEE